MTVAGPEIPFPGLEPFGDEYAPYFFGRKGDCRIVTANLEAARLTVLYGPSAVGKSSVLLAGVLRALHGQMLEPDDGEPAAFAAASLRSWTTPPLPRLVEEIRRAAMSALGGEELEPWDGREPVVDVLRRWTERVSYLYVVLDQFEEYFLYRAGDEGDRFEAELARMITTPDLRVHVLLSLREDCLSLLDRFKGTIPGLWSNSLRIAHLDRTSARKAIEAPVEAYNKRLGNGDGGWRVEPELVDELLASDDLCARRQVETDGGIAAVPDAAPGIETSVLQLVLRRLWREEAARGEHRLRRATLMHLGGPKRIVQDHLETAMNALSPAERKIAVDVLRFLVTPSRTKIAYTAAELAAVVEPDAPAIAAVLDRLAARKIMRRVMSPGDGDGAQAPARYEIFHDVLADPILDWRAAEVARRGRAAAEERVRAAREQARRERRRALVSLALAAVALAGLAAAGVGWLQAGNARDSASSQKLANKAMAALAIAPERSVELALDGLDSAETREAEDALRAALPASRLRGVLPGRRWALSVDFAAGRRLAAGDQAGAIRVWDWKAKRELLRIQERGSVGQVALSDPGDLLLSFASGKRSRVALWKLEECERDRRCRPAWSETRPDAVAAALSPDGAAAAVAHGPDVTIREVDECLTGTCRPAQALRHAGGGYVAAIAFAETRNLLATVTSDGKVSVWRRRGGRYRQVHQMDGRWNSSTTVAVSARTGLVAGGGDSRARVWDLARCAARGARPSRCAQVGVADTPDWVNAVDFNPQGTRFVVASEDGSARVWDRRARQPLVVLRGHADTVFGADFDASGAHVATASADRGIRIWDVSAGDVVAQSRRSIASAAFVPGEGSLVTAGGDGTVRINGRDGRPEAILLVSAQPSVLSERQRRRAQRAGAVLEDLGTRPARVQAAVPSPDGRWIVTADTDGGLLKWDIATCRRVFACQWQSRSLDEDKKRWSPVGSVAVNATGTLVAAVYEWEGFVLVDPSGTRRAFVETQEEMPTGVSFSPRGDRLVTTSAGGHATVWDVSGCAKASCRPRRLSRLPHPAVVYGAAFSPDGKRIVTAGGDRSVRLWSWEDRHPEPMVLEGHTSNVRTVAFDRSGERVVSAGSDTTTRVWDARTGRLLGQLQMHTDRVNAAGFDPRDPMRILTASEDGSARLYRCETCVPLDELRRRAARRAHAVHARAPELPAS